LYRGSIQLDVDVPGDGAEFLEHLDELEDDAAAGRRAPDEPVHGGHTYREDRHYRLDSQRITKTEGEKGWNRRAAHRRDACMLGEAGEGPEWLDFAGDQRGRRVCGRPCTRCQIDCFIVDGVDDAQNTLASSVMRFGNHGSGVTVESRKPRPAVIVGVKEEGDDGKAVPRRCSEERGKVSNGGATCGMAASFG
jgi:hypothetical protein